MAWGILLLAGLLEIGWAVGLKYTDGFTRLWPTIGTAAALISSMAILGIALFGEPAGALRLVCIALTVAGILGLKLASAA